MAALLTTLVAATVATTLATLWKVDIGTGADPSHEFELGPMIAGRSVAQTLQVRSTDFLGVQILARAVGTVAPLTVDSELVIDGQPIGSAAIKIFPSTTLQLKRVTFPKTAAQGEAIVRLRVRPGQAGGVAYGATRLNQFPDGGLVVDERVEFTDQDLALRPMFHRSLWTHLEAIGGDVATARAIALVVLLSGSLSVGLGVATIVRHQ